MKKIKPVKEPNDQYTTIWKLVDGALRDTLKHHPEYINRNVNEKTIRTSFNKRITGLITGYLDG